MSSPRPWKRGEVNKIRGLSNEPWGISTFRGQEEVEDPVKDTEKEQSMSEEETWECAVLETKEGMVSSVICYQ